MKQFFRVIFAAIALALVGCEEPNHGIIPDTTITSLGTPENSEIWFVTTDARDLLAIDEEAFDVAIEEIAYTEEGVNIIRFAGPLTEIREGAFRHCTNLFNISLPNSVVTIGEEAFFECYGMECITFGNSLQRFESRAFDNCLNLYSIHAASIKCWCKIEFANATANPTYYSQALIVNGQRVTQLTIPEGVAQIGSYAFYNNTALKEVIIPASMTEVGVRAFEGCDNIQKVSATDINAWCGIDFANETANPLSLAGELYSNGKAVTNLSTEGVTEIKTRTFIGCTSLQTLTTDNTLTSIGIEAFRACASLSKVTLGERTEQLGERAFMGCQSLNSVTIAATTPPALGDSYVFGYNAEGRTIYVPGSAVEAYRSEWSEYADAITAINE